LFVQVFVLEAGDVNRLARQSAALAGSPLLAPTLDGHALDDSKKRAL